MTTILPIKLSIHSIPANNETNTLSLLVTFNSLSEIFSPPFEQLPMYLVNFPTTCTLLLKFLKNNQPVLQATASIHQLIDQESVDLPLSFIPVEDDDPEKTRSQENDFFSVASVQGVLKIERNNMEKPSFALEFDQFVSLSQKSLEISMGLRRNELVLDKSEKLGMEIFDFGDFQEVTPQKLKNIRCLFVGVNEKLKVFEAVKERMEKAERRVAEEVEKREKLQKKFRTMCLEYAGNIKSLETQVQELENSAKVLKANNHEVEVLQRAFDDYKTQKVIEIEVLSGKLQQLQVTLSAEKQIEQPKPSETSENPKKLSETSENPKILSINEGIIAEYQQSLQLLTEENGKISDKFQELVAENGKLKDDLVTYQQESITLKSSLLELESRCVYGAELEDQLKKMEIELKKAYEELEELKKRFKDVNDKLLQGNKELLDEKNELVENNKRINQEFVALKGQLIDVECKYLEIQGKTYESTQETSVSYTALTQQNLQLLKDSKDFCEVSNRLESNMVQEFNIVIQSLLSTSSNYLVLQRLQSRILQYLRDKDFEMLALKKVMGDIQKQKAAYVPVRGDFIDNQLANFLNSSPTPIEVPFTRLEPGIYLFGTKRVVLRVENIGIVIRVGGGFIKLEDFINNQSVFEIGKIKEREVRERKGINPSPDIKERKAINPSPDIKERKAINPSPDVKERKAIFSSPDHKERKPKGHSPKVEERKIIIPSLVEVERPPSPKILYTQRSSISSGIPMPKTVSSLIERKSTMDAKKRSSVASLPDNL